MTRKYDNPDEQAAFERGHKDAMDDRPQQTTTHPNAYSAGYWEGYEERDRAKYNHHIANFIAAMHPGNVEAMARVLDDVTDSHLERFFADFGQKATDSYIELMQVEIGIMQTRIQHIEFHLGRLTEKFAKRDQKVN